MREIRGYMASFKEWLELREYSPRTITQYLIFERLWPKELTQDTLNKFLLAHPQTLPRAFAKRYLIFLGNKELEIPERRGRTPGRIPIFVPVEDYLKLRDSPEVSQRVRLITALSFIGGLRRVEIANLRGKDINEKNNTVRGIGKGNQEFVQKITSRENWLIPALIKYAKDNNIGPEDKLFGLKEVQLSNIVREACANILGKAYTLHKFRHGHCSYLRSLGRDLPFIQRSARHKNPNSTLIYMHISTEEFNEKQKEALELL